MHKGLVSPHDPTAHTAAVSRETVSVVSLLPLLESNKRENIVTGEKKSDGGRGRGEGVTRAGTGGQGRIQEQSTLRVGYGDKTN